mgnify:CR=1 FL=1
MEWRQLWVCWLLSGACGGTSATSDQPDAGPSTWRLPRNAGAIFSPAFQAAPPAGKFLRLSVHEQSTEQACRLYQTDFEGSGTLAFIRLTTNRYQNGRYNVVEQLTPRDDPQVQVKVIESRAGIKVRTFSAIEGTLELSALPETLDDWRTGRELRGSLRAGFAADPVVTSECTRSLDRQSNRVEAECHCRTHSGRETICTPESEGTCCVSEGPAVKFHELSIAAVPCSFLCAWTQPDLAALCAELE